MFYFSLQYTGTSINENLLSGPDLISQLVTVSIRFRVGPVAFMADIHGMFYQEEVPEKQRLFLRFLWLNKGNLDSEMADHEMCIHLFRVVSSHSSSN